MPNLLQLIVNRKKQNIAASLKHPNEITQQALALLEGKMVLAPRKPFKERLQLFGLQVIAEIKRHSPSKGKLAAITDPVALAHCYCEGGASAISVLTDEHFAGSLADLKKISTALQDTPCCILRKDFIVAPFQIAEAIVCGADAVLLIVAILQEKTGEFLKVCDQLGIMALVEVHTAEELKVAVDAGATVIGINNRNLSDFTVDTQRAFELASLVPSSLVKVAESGITEATLAHRYDQAGFKAVLVGEALVTHPHPQTFIRAMRGHGYASSFSKN